MDFEWDEANIAHIARHGVLRNEVEEAMETPVFLDAEDDEGDLWRDRYVGITRLGRILLVVVTMRGARMRPVTSFDAPRGMKLDFLAGRLS